ncbi:MAG: proline dehydrogenase [Bacteroidetes bacterium]|nr:proline dehydrogenase [Bacteroidota bacterium]
MIASPKLVKTGKHFINFCNKLHIPINWAIKPTIYKQFCGGITLDECLPLANNLTKFKVYSILDYSSECQESEAAFQHVLNEISYSIELASQNKNIAYTVFKPSALAREELLVKASSGEILSDTEKKEVADFKNRLDILCKKAFDNNIRILIDAEDHSYLKIVDDTTVELMKKYNKENAIVFITLQMYRWDRIDYLRDLIAEARTTGYKPGVKLVRGAYMERERRRAAEKGYPSPIYPNKAGSDAGYDGAQKLCVENIDIVSLFSGTHNEQSCEYLVNLMAENKLQPGDNRIFFSQLLGMSDHLSFNLAAAGYNVAKYIPYGPVREVLPYLIRRAEENTSVAGQTGRELRLITKELNRRKIKV